MSVCLFLSFTIASAAFALLAASLRVFTQHQQQQSKSSTPKAQSRCRRPFELSVTRRRMAPSTSSSSSTAAPRGKVLVLTIALASIIFHLVLSSKLGWLSSSLTTTISDRDDDDWRRLEGIKALVGVGRAVSLASGAVAALGLYGILKDHLPFLRLFTLNSFISLGGELSLLLIIAFLALSSSSKSVSSSICTSISNADLSLDLFGWSQEACEERLPSLLVTIIGFAATISLLRAWCSLQVLGYYTSLSKRLRRRPHLSINTRSTSYRDSNDPESAGGLGGSSSSSSKRQRIFLLPQPIDREREESDVPLLSLTTSTPQRSTFPPTSFPPTSSTTASTSGGSEEQPKYLVYAPVMMTAEEARTVGARELIVGGSGRTRSRSNPSTSMATTPLSAHPASAVELPTPTSMVPLVLDESGGKGKLA